MSDQKVAYLRQPAIPPIVKGVVGVPGLGPPPTSGENQWTNFLLDQSENARRAGRHKAAERFLNAAWEAYFRGR